MPIVSCTIFIVITRLKLPHIHKEFFVTGQGTCTVPSIYVYPAWDHMHPTWYIVTRCYRCMYVNNSYETVKYVASGVLLEKVNRRGPICYVTWLHSSVLRLLICWDISFKKMNAVGHTIFNMAKMTVIRYGYVYTDFMGKTLRKVSWKRWRKYPREMNF